MHHYTWPSPPPHGGWGGWGRHSENGRRGEIERRDKDVKEETERGAAPGDEAVAMPKQPGGPETHAAAHMHACRVNKGGRGRLVGAGVSERCYRGWPEHANSPDSERSTSTGGRGADLQRDGWRPLWRLSAGENVLHVHPCCSSSSLPPPHPPPHHAT